MRERSKPRTVLVVILFLGSIIFMVNNTSDNGSAQTSWTKYANNPVLQNGGSGDWDENIIKWPAIIKDGNLYKMWYTGYNNTGSRIGYATSLDGVTWTKDDSNPVLDHGSPGEWDEWIASPTVIKDGATFKMWYCGDDETHVRIGYATSPDGITWTEYASNPVFDLGNTGEWDDYDVRHPTVLYIGAIYKMWYSGKNFTSQDSKIGYATSSDGVNWIRYSGNPVMKGTSGDWDAIIKSGGNSMLFNGTYKFWYTGMNSTGHRIGYATSPDGITWTKYPGNPILVPGQPGEWDDSDVQFPTVLLDDYYKLWFWGLSSSSPGKFGYAYDETSDFTSPIISNLQPSDGTQINDDTPTISADYSDSLGINTSTVVLMVDGTDVTSDATVTTSGISYSPATALPGGIHTVYLEVKDISSNQNMATESWSFAINVTLDKTPPTITNQKPSDTSTINDDTPTISANYSDETGIDLNSILLKVDDTNVTSSASITDGGMTYLTASPLSDGTHTVYLEVKDNSTNRNMASMSWTFTVDTSSAQKDFLSEYWWLLLVILIAAILIISLLLLRIRRRKNDLLPSPAGSDSSLQPPPT
jgi:predicted GH43/DUF377 family glycosyl hydrolase